MENVEWRMVVECHRRDNAVSDHRRIAPTGGGSFLRSADWRRIIPALVADGTRWLVVKPTAHPGSIEDLKASYSYLKGLT